MRHVNYFTHILSQTYPTIMELVPLKNRLHKRSTTETKKERIIGCESYSKNKLQHNLALKTELGSSENQARFLNIVPTGFLNIVLARLLNFGLIMD